jgi:hypothetical protein
MKTLFEVVVDIGGAVIILMAIGMWIDLITH